jgi:RNase H-fold protein (predicted Holliday junction resolvase)
MILAIDPGREKCGLALLDENGTVLEKEVLKRPDLFTRVKLIASRSVVSAVVMGEGAFGRAVEKELRQRGIELNVVFVSEKDSTFLARKKYWKDHPPRGIFKFIPVSLRVPPAPVDDYAAVILGERYLNY